MKPILIFFSLLVFVLNTNAQQDPQAKALLDKLANITKNYECIESQFTYSITSTQQDFDYTREGIIVLKGDKYRLNLMGVETYFDGETIWSFIIDANEVNITVPDPENTDFFLSNPKAIFTIYSTDYKHKYIGEVEKEGIVFHELDLYPKDIENSDYSRFKVLISKATEELHSISAFAKNGNIYSVVINKLDGDAIYEDDYFVFNNEDYPDVEIIDMRE